MQQDAIWPLLDGRLDFQRDKNRLPGESQGCSGLITARPSSKAMSQSLWSRHELVNGSGLLNRESDRKLKSVKGVNLSGLPVPGDEVAGGLEVSVQNADRGDGIEGVWKSGDLRLAAIAARLVFSARPGVSRIHGGKLRRLIEVVRKDVGR